MKYLLTIAAFFGFYSLILARMFQPLIDLTQLLPR